MINGLKPAQLTITVSVFNSEVCACLYVLKVFD